MEYTAEQLDRSSGDMVKVSLGNWITVTELGEKYGVGPKEIRVILHHMGLLQPEGRHGRYRLTKNAVSQGLGKRHERSGRVRWPFDVISPKGQDLIAAAWATTIADIERERRSDPSASRAEAALEAFQESTGRVLGSQEAVCWLADHFPDLLQRQMASILNVSEPLVSRYLRLQRDQRSYGRWLKGTQPIHYSTSEKNDLPPTRPVGREVISEAFDPDASE
jgi:transcriptional regulator with XRE-family HTH domain